MVSFKYRRYVRKLFCWKETKRLFHILNDERGKEKKHMDLIHLFKPTGFKKHICFIKLLK